MENNNFAIVKKSKAPVIIILVCALLAGMVTAALLFFLGNNASSYERAERNALNALFSSFSPWLNTSTSAAESGSITITPSSDLANLPIPGIPDLSEFGSMTFNYEAIVDGSDIYAMLGAELLGINASFEYWQLGSEMIMHLPGISEYYILLNEVFGATGMENFNFDIDYDEMLKELKKIGDAVLDRYFELTADLEPAWSEEVFVGELSRNADVFEVIIDEAFLYEIAVAGFDAFLESKVLMDFIRNIYDLENHYYVDYAWYQTFDEAIEEMRKELYEVDVSDFDGEEFVTMRVYISGKDVIRRDIIVDGMAFSYSSITERNGQYAKNARLSTTDWRGNTTIITYRDEGATDKDYSTGQIRFGISGDNVDDFSFTVEYEDFRLYDNGMFSGDINISIPIEEALNIEIGLSSSVTGSSQSIGVSVAGNIYGIELRAKVVDIDITTNANTGKSITRPPMTDNNTIDMNDWRAMEAFGEDIMSWAADLDMGFIADLLFSTGSDILFVQDYYLDDYRDWGDWCTGEEWCWCDDCYDLWDWDNYDWCTGDEWCWCDDCYDWDDDYNWNYDDECSGDEWCWCSSCYELKVCDSCDNVHWMDSAEDYAYAAYILNTTEAGWRVVLGNIWDDRIWDSILNDFGNCAFFLWYEWFEAIESYYGFDVTGIYNEVMDAIHSADWFDYIDDWDESYYWSAGQWESFYRLILNDLGFAF
ncbi:MAG: hypothetical protein LBC86_09575 [Oscillospiraceae bacterium]|jgi:hypothetical protein|nr:hypothetical protein [Oscillospiraceae bacterium]